MSRSQVLLLHLQHKTFILAHKKSPDLTELACIHETYHSSNTLILIF